MTFDPAVLQTLDAAFQRPEHAAPMLERRHALLRLSCAPSLAPVSYAWVIAGAHVRRFSRNIGCDGVTYTLSAEAGFAAVKLTWWWNGPDEWSELTTWARGMMTRLHAITSPGEPLWD